MLNRQLVSKLLLWRAKIRLDAYDSNAQLD